MPSTATIAGALEAIEQRLIDNWTTSRIVLNPENPGDPWPPIDADGVLQPWVLLEIESDFAEIIGFGSPTNNSVLDSGTCFVHVMVEKGEGLSRARAHAVTIGEIFRQKTFYTSDATAYVRTLTPKVGRQAEVDEGNWVSMTCAFGYEFYHRA